MRNITRATIEGITTTIVDDIAITEINEELSKGLDYWRISSITLSKNDKGLPNRLTKAEAEAIIEFAKSTPTTEELEANMARLKAKYEAIYGEKVEDFGKDGADTTPHSSEVDEVKFKKDEAYAEYQKAFDAFCEDGISHEETLIRHKAKNAAYRKYKEIQEEFQTL